MESLNPIFWISGVILLYAIMGLFAVLIAEGFKYKSLPLGMSAVVGLIPAYLCVQFFSLPSAPKFLVTTVIALAGLALAYLIFAAPVKDWQRKKQRKEYVRKITYHLILLTGSVIFLTPFAWLVTTSLKEEDQIFKYPPVWIPTQQVKVYIQGEEYGLSTLEHAGHTLQVAEILDFEDGSRKVRVMPDQVMAGETFIIERSALTQIRAFGPKWANYREALEFLPEETRKGFLYLWNTVYVTALSIIGTIFSCSLVAYSFARLRWPGRDALFIILIATMMLPMAVTMIPVFLIFRTLGWVDTLRPLWIPSFFGTAFGVFLLRQFFLTIPTELEDAAKIDGCSYFGIYWRIMLPLIKPALAALTIMTFMGSWNNFMGPLIYINSPEKMTLAYGLQLFQGAYSSEFGMLMAASTLVMLPVLLVFFFTQRYFIQGITLTGIKG